jgi:Cyclin M transmembrane N-terminal domain
MDGRTEGRCSLLLLSAILFELTILLLLTLVNGAFALAETALVSARSARLAHRAARGDRGARRALDLLAAPTRFLSTVQLGITLVGVVAGAFGGATLSTRLAAELHRVPLLAPSSEALGFGLVALVVTYLTLAQPGAVAGRPGGHGPHSQPLIPAPSGAAPSARAWPSPPVCARSPPPKYARPDHPPLPGCGRSASPGAAGALQRRGSARPRSPALAPRSPAAA